MLIKSSLFLDSHFFVFFSFLKNRHTINSFMNSIDKKLHIRDTEDGEILEEGEIDFNSIIPSENKETISFLITFELIMNY